MFECSLNVEEARGQNMLLNTEMEEFSTGMFKSNMRILIVDDEPFNLMAMETVLKKAGAKIDISTEILSEITDYATSGD